MFKHAPQTPPWRARLVRADGYPYCPAYRDLACLGKERSVLCGLGPAGSHLRAPAQGPSVPGCWGDESEGCFPVSGWPVVGGTLLPDTGAERPRLPVPHHHPPEATARGNSTEAPPPDPSFSNGKKTSTRTEPRQLLPAAEGRTVQSRLPSLWAIPPAQGPPGPVGTWGGMGP